MDDFNINLHKQNNLTNLYPSLITIDSDDGKMYIYQNLNWVEIPDIDLRKIEEKKSIREKRNLRIKKLKKILW